MADKTPPPVWLASFVAVVDHGTFTAAANALNRAQPRVSSHVASLERELGVPLLERHSTGVRLTQAGSVFLPHARSVLRQLRNGVDAVATLTDTLHGRIRIGSYPGAMAVILAPLVQRYQSMYPGVVVELREGEPGPLEDAVAAQEIDLALWTSDVPQRHHDVPSRPLFHEKIVLIVQHDHPLARSSEADPTRLGHETFIVSSDPSVGWSDYRDRLDRVGVDPVRMITVVQPTTVVALVREGLGVGLLGALAAKVTVHREETVAVALPSPLWQREIRLYRSIDAVDTPALDAFVELLTHEGPTLATGRTLWPANPAPR